MKIKTGHRVYHRTESGIAFFSDTNGKYQGWLINADGSNLRRVTEKEAEMPLWSPGGERILYNISNGFPLIYDSNKGVSDQKPQKLSGDISSVKAFFASSWSSDGLKLAGFSFDEDKSEDFLSVYDFSTKKYQLFNIEGIFPVWLADNRRVLFSNGTQILLLDTETKRLKEIISVVPNRIQSIGISKDNRSIYYSMRKQESDIWMATSKD